MNISFTLVAFTFHVPMWNKEDGSATSISFPLLVKSIYLLWNTKHIRFKVGEGRSRRSEAEGELFKGASSRLLSPGHVRATSGRANANTISFREHSNIETTDFSLELVISQDPSFTRCLHYNHNTLREKSDYDYYSLTTVYSHFRFHLYVFLNTIVDITLLLIIILCLQLHLFNYLII